MRLPEVCVRRGGKEKRKEKGRPGRVEGRLRVADSRNEHGGEKGVFVKANLRALGFLFLLQGSLNI